MACLVYRSYTQNHKEKDHLSVRLLIRIVRVCSDISIEIHFWSHVMAQTTDMIAKF